MRKLISLLLLFAVSMSAQAETFKKGYGACITEDLYDQFVSAAVDKDNRALKYLVGNGCVITKAGIPVSIIDSKWTGKVKVRAYVGDGAIVVWTNRKALRK